MTKNELILEGYITVGCKGTFECLAKVDPFDNNILQFCTVDKNGRQFDRTEYLDVNDIVIKYRAVKMLGLEF